LRHQAEEYIINYSEFLVRNEQTGVREMCPFAFGALGMGEPTVFAAAIKHIDMISR
jgi:hypothetical protein